MEQMELFNQKTVQIINIAATIGSLVFGCVFSLIGFLLRAAFSELKNEVRELRVDVSRLTNTVVVMGETGKNDHERIGEVEKTVDELKKELVVIGVVQQRCKSCNPRG